MTDTFKLLEFLTTAEAAEAYDYSPRWLRQLVAEGKVASFRVADRLLIERDSLLTYKMSPKAKGGRPRK
jgi:hypothetical protein